MAKAPEKQTPGVYKRRIGDAMVTVINDGFLDIPFEILRGTGMADMKDLMKATFRDEPPRLTVNAFVIETGRPSVATLVNMVAMQLELGGEARSNPETR